MHSVNPTFSLFYFFSRDLTKVNLISVIKMALEQFVPALGWLRLLSLTLPDGIPASFPFIYKCRTTYLKEHKKSVQPMGQDGEGEREQGSLVIWHILQPEPRGNLFLRALNKH